MPTTSITFEHEKGNDPSNLDDGETCEHEIEVELEYEPADPSYGADADGNRGMYVPGYFTATTDAPEKCAECGHIYSPDELKEISKQIDQAANDYEEESDYPEPEWDDYERFGPDE